MSGKKWIVTIILSPIAFAAGTFAYRYTIHHRVPAWTDIPGIAVSWFFFSITYIGLQQFLVRRREQRRSV